MEKQENTWIVMTRDGAFERMAITDPAMDIGDEVDVPVQRAHRNWRRLAVAAVLMIAVLFGGAGYGLYMTPEGYISVEINPSVEVVYNRFHRVIDVVPVNHDGEMIIRDLKHIKYDPVEDALLAIVQEADEQQYLRHDGTSAVLFTVAEKEISAELIERVARVEQHVAEGGDVQSATLQTSVSDYEALRASEQPVGRTVLEASLKEQAIEAGVPEEELKNKSVGDLIKTLKATDKENGKPKGNGMPEIKPGKDKNEPSTNGNGKKKGLEKESDEEEEDLLNDGKEKPGKPDNSKPEKDDKKEQQENKGKDKDSDIDQENDKKQAEPADKDRDEDKDQDKDQDKNQGGGKDKEKQNNGNGKSDGDRSNERKNSGNNDKSNEDDNTEEEDQRKGTTKEKGNSSNGTDKEEKDNKIDNDSDASEENEAHDLDNKPGENEDKDHSKKPAKKEKKNDKEEPTTKKNDKESSDKSTDDEEDESQSEELEESEGGNEE